MNTATRPPVTQRQRQILRLVSTGKDDKTIAAELCISIRTVQQTVARAVRRLGANNRPHAVRCCYERGIFSAGEGDHANPT